MLRYWEVVDDNGVLLAAGVDGGKENEPDVGIPEDKTPRADEQKEE